LYCCWIAAASFFNILSDFFHISSVVMDTTENQGRGAHLERNEKAAIVPLLS